MIISNNTLEKGCDEISIKLNNNYYTPSRFEECRESVICEFYCDVINVEEKKYIVPNLNDGETVVNMEYVESRTCYLEKSPNNIAYKTGAKFIKKYVDSAMKCFFNDRANFIHDVDIINNSTKSGINIDLTFKVNNRDFLGIAKMSVILGLARNGFKAVLFEDIKNMNLFRDMVSSRVDFDYDFLKQEYLGFYKPFHMDINSVKDYIKNTIFDTDFDMLKLFPNNNDLKNSWWHYDDEDGIVDIPSYGFVNHIKFKLINNN